MTIKANQNTTFGKEKELDLCLDKGKGSISLKNNNQTSINLVYHLVFYAQTKYIDI